MEGADNVEIDDGPPRCAFLSKRLSIKKSELAMGERRDEWKNLGLVHKLENYQTDDQFQPLCPCSLDSLFSVVDFPTPFVRYHCV